MQGIKINISLSQKTFMDGRNLDIVVDPCNLSTWEADRGRSLSLNYRVRPCFKKQKKTKFLKCNWAQWYSFVVSAT